MSKKRSAPVWGAIRPLPNYRPSRLPAKRQHHTNTRARKRTHQHEQTHSHSKEYRRTPPHTTPHASTRTTPSLTPRTSLLLPHCHHRHECHPRHQRRNTINEVHLHLSDPSTPALEALNGALSWRTPSHCLNLNLTNRGHHRT